MSYIQVTNLLTPYIYNGEVILNGTVEFYEAGTSTPLTVYTDASGNGGATTRTFESTGVILAYVLDTAPAMKQIIKDSTGATLFTFDNLIFDATGDLSSYLPLAGGTMNGALNMGSNDINAGGDITVGSNKHFIADQGGATGSIHPDDALYVANTGGNVSIRGGASLGVYDDGTLALSINSTDVIATGDITVTPLAGNTDEFVTLNASGKLLASGTTLTTINNSISSVTSNLASISGNLQAQITSNDGDIATNAGNISTNAGNISTNAGNISTLSTTKVSKAGDTMSGNLDMGLNSINNIALANAVGFYVTNGGGDTTLWEMVDNGGVFQINDSTSTVQFAISGASVNVQGNRIVNVGDAVNANDAVNLSQLQGFAYLPIAGGKMTGNLQLGWESSTTHDIAFRNSPDTADLFSINASASALLFNQSGSLSLSLNSSGLIFNGLKTISNVADGSTTNQAVNKGQLNDLPTHSTCIQTTVTDDDTKVPTGGAVVDYVAANGGGSITAVYTDTDVSNSAISNTFSIAATGVGDSTKGARVLLNIVIKDTDTTDNYDYYTVELTRPVGSSTFYYSGHSMPLANTSIAILGASIVSGSNAFVSRTLIDSFGSYSSTNYAVELDCYVESNAIYFYMDRETGTPASWTQMTCNGKVEIYG